MIRPIETYYRGHRFRSRLEARWAVFLSRLGIIYHYEFEGFHLPSGDYLPDFYCPNIMSATAPLGAFIEIKPLPCPYKPRRSTSRNGLNKNLLLLPLPQPVPREVQFGCEMHDCGPCGLFTIVYGDPVDVFEGKGATLSFGPLCVWINNGPLERIADDPLPAAYVARAARFEHNEQPC